MGKTEKKRKENHATKVTKTPKTKRQKYGMNETLIQGNSMMLAQKMILKALVSISCYELA